MFYKQLRRGWFASMLIDDAVLVLCACFVLFDAAPSRPRPLLRPTRAQRALCLSSAAPALASSSNPGRSRSVARDDADAEEQSTAANRGGKERRGGRSALMLLTLLWLFPCRVCSCV